MAGKMSVDIIRTPPDVNGHYWKPHRPIRMLLEEGHGHENFLQISTDIHGPVPGQ